MAALVEIVNWIRTIPGTFWGVVVGSFFSLGGVVLSNRANLKRLKAQLAHDREVVERKRELLLKKEVYLEAAEAISAGLIAVGRFANLDVPFQEIASDFVKKSSAIAKVHIIADQETMNAVTEFQGELESVYMRLSADRVPLAVAREEVDRLKRQIDASAKERERLLDVMKAQGLEGNKDERRWNVLQADFEFEQNRAAQATSEHADRALKLQSAQLKYAQECVREYGRLSLLLVPAVASVRKELDLPIDAKTYSDLVARSVHKQAEDFERLITTLEIGTAEAKNY